MDISKYFSESRATIAEAQKQQRDELLISLGLFEVVKEYAPDEINNSYDASRTGYKDRDSDSIDGKPKYYKMKQVALEVSDEEYAEICRLEELKRQLKPVEEVKPAPPVEIVKTTEGDILQEENGANTFGIVVGIILQIMGLIIAFIGGKYFELSTTFGGDSYTYIYQACIHMALYLRIGLCGILFGVGTILEVIACKNCSGKIQLRTK